MPQGEDDEIERVRRHAAEQSWTVARVVREIGGVDMFDSTIRGMCRASKDEVLPGSLAAMPTGGSVAKQEDADAAVRCGVAFEMQVRESYRT
jgi:hypothetical protein